MGARSLAAQAHPCWIIGASAVVNILKNVPSKCRGNPSVKNTRKREAEAVEIKKHNLRKGV
jgi:hypothetical protein